MVGPPLQEAGAVVVVSQVLPVDGFSDSALRATTATRSALTRLASTGVGADQLLPAAIPQPTLPTAALVQHVTCWLPVTATPYCALRPTTLLTISSSGVGSGVLQPSGAAFVLVR